MPPHPTPDTFLVSVVIPAYNNGAALDLTLDTLTRQSLPASDFDVVVADNGSDPPLAPVVDKYADRLAIRCVRHPQDRGRAANRNLGAAAARSNVLVFLDSDTPAHPDLLRRHLLFHHARDFGPGVLIARRHEIDWAAADALRRGESPPAPTVGEYRGDLRDGQLSTPHYRRDLGNAPWTYAYTHNVSMDRASFVASGGFDEAMVGWGQEDTEFFYRVFHLHGCPPDLFEFDELALSYHLPHLRSWKRLRVAAAANSEYIFGKHPRYDVELFARDWGHWGHDVGRIGWFRDTLTLCRAAGLARADRLPEAVRAGLRGRRALVAALGASGLALAAGSLTFDHDAPESDHNRHLIGYRIPAGDGTFAVLVNVDLWRFQLPEDLGRFLDSVLARAAEVVLVATAAGPDPATVLPVPFAQDLDFMEDILRAMVDVTVVRYGAVTVFTIRSSECGGVPAT
jgi:glycosyltransferase involved in cell wall biosynthesis